MSRTSARSLLWESLRSIPLRAWPFVVLGLGPQHAVLLYRLSHALYCSGIPFLPQCLRFINVALHGVDIAPGAFFGSNLTIYHGTGLVVGSTVTAGDNVELFHGVTLGGRSGRLIAGRSDPCLGNGVRVHCGAVVLGPITVGDFADIGANAVVLDNVPAYAVVAGNPARVLRTKAHNTVDSTD